MDIVEKLRFCVIGKYDIDAAADEIERLRRLNSEYREALEYIADMPDGWEEDEELNLLFVVDNHVKAAREALGENA